MFIEQTGAFLTTPFGGAGINSARLPKLMPLLRAEPEEFLRSRSINMSPLTRGENRLLRLRGRRGSLFQSLHDLSMRRKNSGGLFRLRCE